MYFSAVKEDVMPVVVVVGRLLKQIPAVYSSAVAAVPGSTVKLIAV